MDRDHDGRRHQRPCRRAFGLSEYPFFVAIDKPGKVVARAAGELSIPSFERLLDLARGV